MATRDRDKHRAAPAADALASFLADPDLRYFTLPGHKRSPLLAEDEPAIRYDAPGSVVWDPPGGILPPGFVNPQEQAEHLAADLWGVDYARFVVSGSTQGNLALMLAAGPPGSKVIIPRGAHKSLVAGLALAGLEPVWIVPQLDVATGLPLGVTPAAVQAALAAHPDVSAIALVEPSWLGLMGDVAAIADIAHAHGIPLLVDHAWGAAFGFHPAMPPSVMHLGADAAITSIHKTLHAYTPGSLLMANSGVLDVERLERAFQTLNTTSPAAPMIASLDTVRRDMALDGAALLDPVVRAAAMVRDRLSDIPSLVMVNPSWINLPAVHAVDPTKLVLIMPGTGADGFAIRADLWQQGIRLELVDRDSVIPLLTLGDQPGDAERLADALHASLHRHAGPPRLPTASTTLWGLMPQVGMSPRDAFFAPAETVSLADAVGRIAVETVVPYPPGVAALAPGEVVTPVVIDALREVRDAGCRIAYCADPTLATLRVAARR